MLTEPARAVRPAASRVFPDRSAPRADEAVDPEPSLAADGVTIGNLLRCWVRERAIPEPADRILRLAFPNAQLRVEVPVTYWSPVGWHRFGPARIVDAGFVDAGFGDAGFVGDRYAGDRYADDRHWGPGADPGQKLVDPATLAAALALELTGGARPDAVADLANRVADSAANTARFLAGRWARPGDPVGTTPFLSSEQALVTGHPLRPAPKRRAELTAAELTSYSPELRGSFPLHWFAASRELVSSDCALTDPAEAVVAGLVRADLDVPEGMVPIPAHPWQAGTLIGRPSIQALLGTGLLRDLGPAGRMWHPTSSLRTVYRSDSPLMIKLPLALRTDGARGGNVRTRLRRGPEMQRILDAGPGAQLAAAHPGFGIVHDQGWLTVGLPDDPNAETGLDVVLRENPFGHGDLAHCLAGLVAERPGADPSLLACLVKGLSVRSHRRVHEVAREWFGRYLEAVAEPVLWLYAEHGIALAAHQQNTLVVVNGGGWPIGGRYRDDDDQGSCFASSRVVRLSLWLPRAGQESGAIVEDAIADERLACHLGVNNLMALIGAFGSQGLADELVLLDDLRAALRRFARRGGPVPGVVSVLLEADMLRCEANLLTGIGAAGPVHIDIPNPLART